MKKICSTEGGADISSSVSDDESPARLCVDSANRYGPPQGGFVVSVGTAVIELGVKVFQRLLFGGGWRLSLGVVPSSVLRARRDAARRVAVKTRRASKFVFGVRGR